jgi:uncharacterized protein YkwD
MKKRLRALILILVLSGPMAKSWNSSVEQEPISAIMSDQSIRPSQEVDSTYALASPSDPVSDISWSAGTSGVSDIQKAFNQARTTENQQLGTSIPLMTLPSQTEWNNMTDGEKALWLINRERIDRGITPLDNLEASANGVAQYYADYLMDHDAWGHTADGRSPWDRLEDSPAIGACRDFLSVAENIAVLAASGSSIDLPVERSVFMWIYDDGDCCGWGHRHTIFWYSYNDNSGQAGREGFLGIGRASGGPYQGPFSQPWKFAEIIVMNVFDPCADWDYSQTTFADVSAMHPYRESIEILYANGYTGGCSTSPFQYCPDVIMDRAQAAVFMMRGNYGSNYTPVPATHFFGDNWANATWAEGWAESMFRAGLTGGCSSSPLKFCPDEKLTNVQAAVFALRLKYGMSYLPPAATGAVFADMTDTSSWGTSWAEQAYVDGLIPDCGTSGGKPLFCPSNLVSRALGASIIVKAKHMTMP